MTWAETGPSGCPGSTRATHVRAQAGALMHLDDETGRPSGLLLFTPSAAPTTESERS